MINVRVFYKKTGRARFISHLDMLRFFARALKRSGLPVWYTEGFNKHIYTAFPLPLSLGFESMCEFMDMRILPDDFDLEKVKTALNPCLTEDVQVVRVAKVVNKPDAIAFADFDIKIRYDDKKTQEALEALESFLSQPEILVEKTTKKKVVKTIDIAPHIELLEAKILPDTVKLSLRLAAGGSLNINPTLVLSAFEKYAGHTLTDLRIRRMRVLTADGCDFE